MGCGCAAGRAPMRDARNKIACVIGATGGNKLLYTALVESTRASEILTTASEVIQHHVTIR